MSAEFRVALVLGDGVKHAHRPHPGKEALKPASGKLMLRVPPDVHSAALIAAQA